MRDLAVVVGRWVVPIAAIVVIVGGLVFDQPDLRTTDQRASDIAASLRCPFCSGESIQESTTQVARDLQVVIREQVEAGRSDAEIIAFFEARYGPSVRLDPPLSGWGVALWVLPIAAVVAGGFAIAALRRRSSGEPPTIATTRGQEASTTQLEQPG